MSDSKQKDGKVAASYDVQKVDPQIIGSTNDATSWHDISKAPTLQNFQPQPDISGSGPDGGFNPAHKQPQSIPPPTLLVFVLCHAVSLYVTYLMLTYTQA